MYKLFAADIAGKLREMAEEEAKAIFDPSSAEEPHRIAAAVHRYLQCTLTSTTRRLANCGAMSPELAFENVKIDLIKAINRLTTLVLLRALEGCKQGLAAPVSYEYRIDVGLPDEETVSFANEDIYNDSFETVLQTALAVRQAPVKDQRAAIRIVQLLADIRTGEQTYSYRPSAWLKRELRTSKALLEKITKRLTLDFVARVQDFEFWRFRAGATQPYGMPRLLVSEETAFQLAELASNYHAFGNYLKFNLLEHISGAPAAQSAAITGWNRFQGAGRAIRLLAGWISALRIQDGEKLCSICYRHPAVKTRCDEHATKTHETRQGRIGKHIRPDYRTRVDHLQASLLTSERENQMVCIGNADLSALQQAADGLGLTADYRKRLIKLAQELRTFYPLLNDEQKRNIERVFTGIITHAVAVQSFRTPLSLDEVKNQAAQKDEVFLLSSLKGFFQIWFGTNGPYRVAGRHVRGLGDDRRHPVAQGGSLDASQLPGQLLMARAWHEATRDYLSSAMPDRNAVSDLIKAGYGFRKIALIHRLSHQTVRINLARPTGARKRNRFP